MAAAIATIRTARREKNKELFTKVRAENRAKPDRSRRTDGKPKETPLGAFFRLREVYRKIR